MSRVAKIKYRLSFFVNDYAFIFLVKGFLARDSLSILSFGGKIAFFDFLAVKITLAHYSVNGPSRVVGIL